jgi:RecA-family ATPase
MLLDALAKRIDCAIVIIHHASRGSAAMDWTEKAAGTNVMSAATEAQVHVSRFGELEGPAPERLIRVRGRHAADLELVLRFRKPVICEQCVVRSSRRRIERRRRTEQCVSLQG